MQVVGIKFKEDGKVYNFLCEFEVKKEDKVIVETERGIQLGIVSTILEENNNKNKLKSVVRIATDEDYEVYLKNLKNASSAYNETKKIVNKLGLNMTLVDASYSLDKKQLLINFISDERVDFRELVKELASKYHTRIELHQLGIRDKAKEIGGIGFCGKVLCCASHLNNLNTVNINMVKNQNIALNPTKINGACGRLLCCFNYENDIYEENRSKLPKIGDKVKYKNEYCEVIELDVLNKKYKVKTSDNDFEEVTIDD